MNLVLLFMIMFLIIGVEFFDKIPEEVPELKWSIDLTKGSWTYSNWEPICPQNCNMFNQTRTLRCVDANSIVVDNNFCDDSEKPSNKLHRSCGFMNCYLYFTTPWSSCNKGFKTRQVKCSNTTFDPDYLGLCIGFNEPITYKSCDLY